MFNSSSTQSFQKTKNKSNLDTGADFLKQQSFSLQVQAERDYVHRLKQQREKIQILYSKYDKILEEIKSKDQKIKDQERKISQLNNKCRDFSLMVPQLDMLRRQNGQLARQNDHLKSHVMETQNSYLKTIGQYKSKYQYNEKQRQKTQQINDQFMSKLKIFQQKFEDKNFLYEKDRKQWGQKINNLNKQIHELKAKHLTEISIMNTQILHRQEDIDILSKDNQKLRECILQWEQAHLNVCQQYQQKIDKINTDNKIRVKQVKNEIESLNYNNQILVNKITGLNLQIEKLTKQIEQLRNAVSDEKRIGQQSLYEAKIIFNQDKSILRENIIQLQSKVEKLEKLFGESVRKEKELAGTVRRMEENQQLKRNLREVQRRELEKINRLLLLEK